MFRFVRSRVPKRRSTSAVGGGGGETTFDLRFIHQLFRFDGVVQRFEQIFGKINAVVQLVEIIAELLKGHFVRDFLGEEKGRHPAKYPSH